MFYTVFFNVLIFVQSTYYTTILMLLNPKALLGDLAGGPKASSTPTSSAPAEFNQIADSINNVETGVFAVASAAAILMVVVAGTSMMIDIRNGADAKHSDKAAFLKTVLIGYAIVLAATFLTNLVTHSLGKTITNPQ